MSKHRTPKVYLESEAIYFITGRTYGKIPHLGNNERKNIFKNILFEKIKKFSAELINWVILSNHYHLLVNFFKGQDIASFFKELHGSSSFQIKKLPALEIKNDEQILIRQTTPFEKRTEERIERLWRGLKLANTEDRRALKCATTELNVIADFSPRQHPTVIADFSPHKGDYNLRLKELLNQNNFSLETQQKVLKYERELKLAITTDDFLLFKVLISSCFSDIPFWYNYYSHVIRNEKDFYCHFNYIVQNPIKHKIVNNLWQHPFSGVFNYDRRYILDCLRDYPVIDFGGNYD